MTYREWNPGPGLADRVACFWTTGLGVDVVGNSPTVEPLKRVLPDGCMDIIWGPDGLQVAGPDTGAVLVPTRPDDAYVAVRFLPGGAGGIFGVPADALTDARLPLYELWEPSRDAGGFPKVGRPPNGLDDLHMFKRMVAARLCSPGGSADPAAAVLRRALATGQSVPDVAASVGFSVRTLRRRSAAAFGYGPKTLQRILRFQEALGQARAGVELARVAHDCGYSDQAHLAGEVRRLAGVPLTRLS